MKSLRQKILSTLRSETEKQIADLGNKIKSEEAVIRESGHATDRDELNLEMSELHQSIDGLVIRLKTFELFANWLDEIPKLNGKASIGSLVKVRDGEAERLIFLADELNPFDALYQYDDSRRKEVEIITKTAPLHVFLAGRSAGESGTFIQPNGIKRVLEVIRVG